METSVCLNLNMHEYTALAASVYCCKMGYTLADGVLDSAQISGFCSTLSSLSCPGTSD